MFILFHGIYKYQIDPPNFHKRQTTIAMELLQLNCQSIFFNQFSSKDDERQKLEN